MKDAVKTTAFLLFILINTGAFAQTTASFSGTPTIGCAPLTVDFTNASTQANTFFWDFGNGNTSTLPNPTTVYLSPGFFTVTLIAINNLTGQKDTLVQTNYIQVVNLPVVNFTASPLAACEDDNLFTFNNTSTGAVSYTWDFGDGGTSTLTNPTHIYTTAGTYNVKLIGTTSYGCNAIQVRNSYITIYPAPDFSFTSNYSSTCDVTQVFDFTGSGTGITSWNWNFGDGTFSSAQSPSHLYSSTGAYTITLITTNTLGCTDTLYANNYINIGSTLVPSYTVDNTTGCGDLTANFDCTVPNATSWLWDFGDGTTSNIQNPVHQYTAAGNYTVTLTVTTTSGCNGTATFNNAITIDPLPAGNFSAYMINPCDIYSWHFNNVSANGVTYLWNFGDGTSSTLSDPDHVYTAEGIYNITLHVFSANGCEDILTLDSLVNIRDYKPGFNGIPRIGCAPLPVSFTANNYPNAISWFWNFGDGNTSTLQNPSNIYAGIGVYNVSLTITTSDGCIDSLRKVGYINVVPSTVPYTVPDTIIGCTPFTAFFTDPTVGSNYWLWDFGDGDTSHLSNPSHTYLSAGIYVVTLQTNMPGGCGQFFNPYAIVQVFPLTPFPIELLNISPCAPYQLELTNNTAGIVNWIWHFGDGTSSTQQNPTHTYTQPGTYTITLTMTSDNGCEVSQSLSVTVGHENPIVITAPNLCKNDPIQFSISNPGAFTSYTWNFGDGTTSNQQNDTHIYGATGDYIVTLTTIDTSGCTDSFAGDTLHITDVTPGYITNSPLTGCNHVLVNFTNTSSNAITYLWDFGDNTTTTSTNPTHNFTTAGIYWVNLTATNGGCSKTYTSASPIIVNKAVANFSFTHTGPCVPLTVAYNDLSVSPVSWLWNFGGGQTSTLQNPVHTFTALPLPSVSLTITDINGCTATKSKPNVSVIPVVMQASDSVGCTPLLVNFSDLTNTATAWHWDFGDGTTSNVQSPSHTYTTSGSYDVTLIVTIAAGCTDTVVFPNYIYVTKPVPDFVSPTVSVCAPSLVDFNNLSQYATTYLWDFGDGTTSTADNPSHIYNIPGDYTVSLTAYDSLGCSTIEIKIDYIHVPGTYSSFSLTSQLNCLQTMVQFTDSSILATSWNWNFGDGYTSNVQNPQHLYADTGSYIVSLITSDSLGCSSFYSYPMPVVIHPNPSATAATTDTGGCSPYTASFTNTSISAVNSIWNFGDGDTSSIVNPAHTYPYSGTYYVSLIAINQFGCTDTFAFSSPINVDKTPIAQFSTDINSGCSPITVHFTNTSDSLQSSNYLWDFGSGQTSTLQDPIITFPDSGIFSVQLIVQNSSVCADTAFNQITVKKSPSASALISDTIGCGLFPVTFINHSAYADSYEWNFGDGVTSSVHDTTYSYSASGIYYPYLVALSNNGCTDTFHFSTAVNVKLAPIANFQTTMSGECSGALLSLHNISTNLSNPLYNWTIGPLTSPLEEPSFLFPNSGFYTITLIVSNDNGCVDSTSQTVLLQVENNPPPPVTPLLSVSVVDNSSVEIQWLPSAAQDLEEYRLYRLNTLTNTYTMIYSELHPNNSNPNVTGVYVDHGLNTLQNVYTYKLQTIDHCGNMFSLDSSAAHTTINVSAVATGTNIAVSWTPYGGCPVSAYEINRTANGSTQLVATVSPTQLNWFDPGLDCPYQYSYRIKALDLCGNPYTSLSDTAIAQPDDLLADQKVEVVRSTVVFNKSVLTEWGPPNIFPDRVFEYKILRSIDNINFTAVASVPATEHSYIDENVDVNHQNYYYRVSVINDCNLAGPRSNNSSSILLQSDYYHEKSKLWWTRYDKWDTGVDHYSIERKNESGQWIEIKVVDGVTIETEIDE